MGTALSALALSGCATTRPQEPSDVDTLRSQIRELQSRQAEQERQLAQLRSKVEARSGSVAPGHAAAPPVAQVAPPVTTTTRAEATTTTDAPPPHVPSSLKVVYVAPPPVEYDDSSPKAARKAKAFTPPSGPAASLPTETQLKEPVLADAAPAGLSPDPDVEYQAATAAPGSEALEKFAARYPENGNSDNALFEAGLREEKSGHADRAARDFSSAIGQHPAGDVVADALLHLAACDLQLHKPAPAREALTRLTHDFPGTAQADAAQARLQDLSP